MIKFINGYCSVVKKLCYYVCFLSMAMVACMMVLMFVDAMLGLFFNSRITGSYEIVQLMLSVLVFTSWAYTQTEKGHIHVVMFVRMFSHKLRFIAYSITSILSTVTIAVASYALVEEVLSKFISREATGTLLIPYWPFFVFEFIAFVVLAAALLGDTMKAVAAIFNKEVAEDVMSSWT